MSDCPVSLIDFAFNTTYQFMQFSGATIPQILESFMFGMLSNSIKFRDIFMKISAQYSTQQTQNENVSYVTLVEQTSRFAKSVIYFNNLYASQAD